MRSLLIWFSGLSLILASNMCGIGQLHASFQGPANLPACHGESAAKGGDCCSQTLPAKGKDCCDSLLLLKQRSNGGPERDTLFVRFFPAATGVDLAVLKEPIRTSDLPLLVSYQSPQTVYLTCFFSHAPPLSVR